MWREGSAVEAIWIKCHPVWSLRNKKRSPLVLPNQYIYNIYHPHDLSFYFFSFLKKHYHPVGTGKGRGGVVSAWYRCLKKILINALFRVAFFSSKLVWTHLGIMRHLPYVPTPHTRKEMDSVPLVSRFLLVFLIYFISSFLLFFFFFFLLFFFFFFFYYFIFLIFANLVL